MGAVDPKDMTASELLRWAASGEPYNGVDGNRWTYPTAKIKALVEDVTGEWPSDHEAFSIIADKIDAELAEARKDAIRESKKPMWWFRNAIKCGYDWPEPRDGEKFRDYLHRCFLPRPRYEDGEVVGVREYEDIQGYCVYDDGEFFVTTPNRSIDYAAGERVERPAPDVLGADGLPLKVGEVVYSAWYGRRNPPITSVHKAGDTIDGFPAELDFVRYEDGYDWARDLTHTPPDTQQKIDDDATMPPAEYCAVRGIDLGDDPDRATATEAMVLDLLRRQRELDKRTGGAE